MTTSLRLALALLSTTVALTACGGAPEQVAGPPAPVPSPTAPSSAPLDPAAGGIALASGPTAAQLDEPCPAAADEVVEGQPTGNVVGPDAVRARLCEHGVDGTADPSPVQLTGQEAAALAARYAGLAPAPREQVCTQELGPTATVLLSYADGSAVAVATELYGCTASRLYPGQSPALSAGDDLRPALRALLDRS